MWIAVLKESQALFAVWRGDWPKPGWNRERLDVYEVPDQDLRQLFVQAPGDAAPGHLVMTGKWPDSVPLRYTKEEKTARENERAALRAMLGDDVQRLNGPILSVMRVLAKRLEKLKKG